MSQEWEAIECIIRNLMASSETPDNKEVLKNPDQETINLLNILPEHIAIETVAQWIFDGDSGTVHDVFSAMGKVFPSRWWLLWMMAEELCAQESKNTQK